MADFLKTLEVFHGTSNMDETGVEQKQQQKVNNQILLINFLSDTSTQLLTGLGKLFGKLKLR